MTRLFAACAFVALVGASASAETVSQPPTAREVDIDRVNAEQAAAIVNADERFYALVSYRTDNVAASWRHDVALKQPRRAGFAAQEHFKALQVEKDAHWKLLRARMDLTAAREKLILDEYQVQHATYASR